MLADISCIEANMVSKLALLLIVTLLMGTQEVETSFYDFTVTNIRGQEVSMNDFKGKVIMVVNTASLCGFTKQYSDLQKLYDTYREEGFAILGFPANNFGNQEPGTDEEIQEFCEVNFNITFPLFSKVEVTGPQQHPLFAFLTQADNRDYTGGINWNFEKFLIDRNGVLQHRFPTRENPMGDSIQKAVTNLLHP
jgi:glutathione peroxidase